MDELSTVKTHLLNIVQVTEKGANEVDPRMVESSVRAVPSPQLRGGGGIGAVTPERVEWSSIGGLADVKTQLQKAIEWPMREDYYLLWL